MSLSGNIGMPQEKGSCPVKQGRDLAAGSKGQRKHVCLIYYLLMQSGKTEIKENSKTFCHLVDDNF